MKRNLMYFFAGLLVGAFILGGVGFATGYRSTIEVSTRPLTYYFDGIQKSPVEDQQGFIYKGRTYVPLRFISESLGKEVTWEGETFSIYIGKAPGKVTRLEDMRTHTHYESSNLCSNRIDRFVTNTGDVFLSGFEFGSRPSIMASILGERCSFSYEYLLNGDYKRFTALVAPKEGWRNNPKSSEIGYFKIIADGKEIYNTGPVHSDIINPIQTDVDLTGVLRMKLEGGISSDAQDDLKVGLLEPVFIQ